ncbi:MAG: hypothetical protein MUO62_18740, partial [Anaerolineales bacterium]|nr:hypothetical protein [Anaerolineales bacterium]
MNIVDIIAKKRDGEALTDNEIKFFVEGYTRGDIPDYQASAWCMATYFQGMTNEEATAFTMHIAHSGDMLDLHSIAPIVVDKHSTGGVGDKTTLVVSTGNQPGALHRILEPFARLNIGMVHIESRPSRQGLWDYVF